MNQQDKSFLWVATAIIGGLLLITAAIFLIARLVSVVAGYVPDDGSRLQAAAEKRIMPVGRVVLEGDPEAPKVMEPGSLTADEIITQVCAACHQAGVLGAPKIGTKADWESRLANGLDGLVSNAINGINQMPARGGNPNLSDDDVRNSVIAMLEQSEIDTGESAAGGESPAQDSPEAAATDTSTESSTETAAADTTAASAGETGSSEEQTPEDTPDLAQGKELYQACAACHDTGAANAPKLGDQAAWADRIGKGMETLVGNAVNGFNAMPPKGGRMDLSDEQIAAIVAYMVDASK